MCFIGYIIVSLSLFTFVQAKNVYPQLLLARLFFSSGGAAVSTMVTAVLPTMSSKANLDPNSNKTDTNAPHHTHAHTASRVSQATITQSSYLNDVSRNSKPSTHDGYQENHSNIAGLVGMATGCGALVALTIFLPLPARFQHSGTSPDLAIQYSYYIVASFALLIAILCFFGLRGIAADGSSSWGLVTYDGEERASPKLLSLATFRAYTDRLYGALRLGFVQREIFVGYIGGFIARSSSVAISLFIPLLVNAAFLESGLCNRSPITDDPSGLPDLKRRCPRAYVLAAALTGVSQFVALISAPIFGFWSSRSKNKMVPLMASALMAIVGYPLFALRFSPNDEDKFSRAISFIAVCLIGLGQIGAIVCSLAAISSGLVNQQQRPHLDTDTLPPDESDAGSDEDPLLGTDRNLMPEGLTKLKGSVAGIYSFYGGAGILILTKAGGALFDSTTTAAPFYMMTAFNAIMLLSLIVLTLRR